MIIDTKKIVEKVKSQYKTPVFCVLGGSRCYGIYNQDTPYVITGSYAASIVDESGIYKQAPEEEASIHKAPKADAPLIWEMQEIGYLVKRLKSDDLSAFEEINSPFVFLETPKFRELKDISRKILSAALLKPIQERIEKKKQVFLSHESPTNSDILELARDYMQGVYLFRMKKFVVSVKRLNEYFELGIITSILDNMNRKNENYYLGSPGDAEKLFAFLHDEFNSAIEYSILPETAENKDSMLSGYLRSLR
ncbi:MAG: hypothetical protein LWY06_06195 [Firmicutes bacterium]|nr:hypothetical protein [Bacillota bacterium]